MKVYLLMRSYDCFDEVTSIHNTKEEAKAARKKDIHNTDPKDYRIEEWEVIEP